MLSRAHVPGVHTFANPTGQVLSDRAPLKAVRSVGVRLVRMKKNNVRVCVCECVYSSPVLGRASLIGSQTQGISVLHNRVRRHREDGPRDSLDASERGASFWNTAPRYSTSQAQLLRRTVTSTASRKRFIYHDRMNRTSPCIHSLNSHMPQTW